MFRYDVPTSGVYAIRHKVSGKLYIGGSVDIYNRWSVHKNELQYGKHHSRFLQEDWDRCRPELFELILIESCLDYEVSDREQFWLDRTKSYMREYGYNISASSRDNLGVQYQDSSKLKMSEATTRYYINNPDKKEDVRQAVKQRWLDPEFRKRMSEAAKKRANSPTGRTQILAARKGGKPGMVTRKWTVEEDKILDELYGKMPLVEIAEKLGRTFNAVSLRTRRKFSLSS